MHRACSLYRINKPTNSLPWRPRRGIVCSFLFVQATRICCRTHDGLMPWHGASACRTQFFFLWCIISCSGYRYSSYINVKVCLGLPIGIADASIKWFRPNLFAGWRDVSHRYHQILYGSFRRSWASESNDRCTSNKWWLRWMKSLITGSRLQLIGQSFWYSITYSTNA